jgi:hypothetical protein
MEQTASVLEPGERLVWVGQPNPRLVFWRHMPLALAGLLPLALGMVAVLFYFKGRDSDAVILLIGLAFALFGLGLLGSPFFKVRSKRGHWYAVTDRRAIVYTDGARSYLPEALRSMWYHRVGFLAGRGAGDVCFVSEDTGFLYLSDARNREAFVRETLRMDGGRRVAPADLTPLPPAAPTTIPVACACGARLKAPAKAAGRSLTCPKCKATLAVPSLAATPAPAPAPMPAARLLDLPVPARERTRQTDELPPELTGWRLLPNLAQTIEDELSRGERVIWAGKPSAKIMALRGAIWPLLGAILAIPAALILPRLVEFNALHTDRERMFLGVALAVMCLGMAALFATGSLRLASRTTYVLTNRRAMVWTSGLFGFTKETFGHDELSKMRLRKSWVFGEAGDLIFRSIWTTKQVTTRSAGFNQTSETSDITHYGFMAVRHVAMLQTLVRRAVLEGI